MVVIVWHLRGPGHPLQKRYVLGRIFWRVPCVNQTHIFFHRTHIINIFFPTNETDVCVQNCWQFLMGSITPFLDLNKPMRETNQVTNFVSEVNATLRVMGSQNWWPMEIQKNPAIQTESFTPRFLESPIADSQGHDFFFSGAEEKPEKAPIQNPMSPEKLAQCQVRQVCGVKFLCHLGDVLEMKDILFGWWFQKSVAKGNAKTAPK